MNISKNIALQIVTDLSEIINQHVNLMDENGIIIASTDPKRIDTYHAAAHKIITEKIPELNIHNDEEYEGARKGINRSVMLNGDIVGVIGVTGEYRKVAKYSEIIKRMTEILLLENYYMEQQKLDSRIRQRFLDDWLYNEKLSGDPSFVERGNRMGIDVTIPRCVVTAEITELSKYSDNVRGQQIIDSINRIVRAATGEITNSVFTKTASAMICLVAESSDEKLRSFAVKIQSIVKKRHDIAISIGIDSSDKNLTRSYVKAKKAMSAAKNFPQGICFYNDITLETFIDEVPEESKQEFINHIFNGYSAGEINKWIHLLRVYFDTNGSITQSAEKLRMHKNTLQYQLKKLVEKTGRDPRRIDDAALYYLAVQFYSAYGKSL